MLHDFNHIGLIQFTLDIVIGTVVILIALFVIFFITLLLFGIGGKLFDYIAKKFKWEDDK